MKRSPASMSFRSELKWIVPIFAVSVLVFANSVGGEFVYDDTRQIVRNTLIQDDNTIWRALASDVWAFLGDGSFAGSNYWRPTFTAFNILNFRLFGMAPAGWHVLNIVLHALVSVIIFLLLRRWDFSAAVAFSIALIFAVHPVHVESVAWIAGSPDILFALFFLTSVWCVQSFAEKRGAFWLGLGLVLYALALGAKEIGVLCLPIYFIVIRDVTPTSKGREWVLPLAMLSAVAGIYFAARLSVIGAFALPPVDAPTPVEAILSAPAIVAFYLRQIFFPYWMGINYPLKAVSEIGFSTVILPVLILAAAAAAFWYLAKRTHRGLLGAAIFVLPLLPALNILAFTPDQIVHDRYLYLPLLGALMLLVGAAARAVDKKTLVAAACVIATLLSVRTFTYNRAWATDVELWGWTRQIDSGPFVAAQYGSALTEAGRYDDAIAAFTSAIDQKQAARSYLGRGRALLFKKRYDEAERDFKTTLQFPGEKLEAYSIYQAFGGLGTVYFEQRKLDAAAETFLRARQELPGFSAAITSVLAIVLFQNGQRERAVTELEQARDQARRELLPESKMVFLRLGMIYIEFGRKDEARAALTEFLATTANLSDRFTLEYRDQAIKLLQTLG